MGVVVTGVVEKARSLLHRDCYMKIHQRERQALKFSLTAAGKWGVAVGGGR